MQSSVDLTPIPELNADESNITAPQFGDLVRLTEAGTVVLPSPVMENADNLETLIRLSGKAASRPFGQTIQGFLAEGTFDIEAYLSDYAAEQQRFLEESIQEAQAAGADVSMDNWVFPDWDPQANHY